MNPGSAPNSKVRDQISPTSDSSQASGRRRRDRIGTLWALAAALAALLVVPGGPMNLAAQDSYDQPAYPNARQPLSAGQLEQMVAPIALYPDALVAQILAASTYPQQIAEADRWRQSQNYASPETMADGAGTQPWDPSVMALTAFPTVLAQMDRNLQWTSALGNAYYNQPQDVMEAVQVMRRRAQEAGTLQSTPQQVVRDEPGYIELAPANPEVVYVPAYNPWTVYGEPVSPYPGFSLLDSVGDFFSSSLLHYGAGIAMAAFSHTPFGWLAWGLNWLTQAVLFNHSDYYSHSSSVADWGFDRHGYHAYAGRGGFGGYHNAGFRGGERWGGENWRHAGYRGSGWREFGRNSMQSGWGGHSSRGFQSVRNNRSSSGGLGEGWRSNARDGRATYAMNFHQSPTKGFEGSRGREQSRSFERRGGFQGERFGNRSTSNFSGSHFSGSHPSGSVFSSRGFRSSGETAHSSGFHFSNGGHAPKSSGGRGWGGVHSSGGGHAPKSFGGGGHSFGGGHSHGGGGHSGGGHSGGGHSGGHGGSKHH